MQKQYNIKQGLGKTIATWSLVGIASLSGLISGGCLESNSPESGRKRLKENLLKQSQFDPFLICYHGVSNSNPKMNEFFDENCKSCIKSAGYKLEEDFYAQGVRLHNQRRTNLAPMTNIFYDKDNQIVFFNKNNGRYVARLDTLAIAKLHTNENGNSEWKYSHFMTKNSANGKAIFNAINLMKNEARLNAQNNYSRRNPNQNNSKIIDDAKSRTMGNLGTQGLLKFLSEHQR